MWVVYDNFSTPIDDNSILMVYDTSHMFYDIPFYRNIDHLVIFPVNILLFFPFSFDSYT